MIVTRTMQVGQPAHRVFGYLADFTTTTEWDPGTVRTLRQRGDGGVGTTYLNTSKFLGRRTTLTYVVTDFVHDRCIRLRGENRTVISIDTMTVAPRPSGTEVCYTAEFTFKGAARFVAPLLKPALERLADKAQAGLVDALERMPAP